VLAEMVLIGPPLPVLPPPIRRANHGSSPHYISPHVRPLVTQPYDLSKKPSEWLSKSHHKSHQKGHQDDLLKAIRMGRQFDRIMREARHADRVCGCWIFDCGC
jgi:hypothetical protein